METVSLPAVGLSSRSRLRGTKGGRVSTRRKFGPRLDSVARALGVQSRASWQVITGSLSAEPQPRRTMETPQFKKINLQLLYHVCIAPSLKLSNSLLYGSHGQTAVAYQALPFVTATDGASVCTCACCHASCRPGKHLVGKRTHNHII